MKWSVSQVVIGVPARLAIGHCNSHYERASASEILREDTKRDMRMKWSVSECSHNVSLIKGTGLPYTPLT
ncbi:hypothetical protein VNO77_19291 [Canavalia gladiata]|uniref:Uncharacterized protein n=1 Tax=Canavalia gladiata TaxID=3824 RepID=A0AAN9LME2_CANGL